MILLLWKRNERKGKESKTGNANGKESSVSSFSTVTKRIHKQCFSFHNNVYKMQLQCLASVLKRQKVREMDVLILLVSFLKGKKKLKRVQLDLRFACPILVSFPFPDTFPFTTHNFFPFPATDSYLFLIALLQNRFFSSP